MEVIHSLIAGTVVLGVAGIIAWGANSCSVQETALREACIRSGGSLIVMGEQKSHCIGAGRAAAP